MGRKIKHDITLAEQKIKQIGVNEVAEKIGCKETTMYLTFGNPDRLKASEANILLKEYSITAADWRTVIKEFTE